MANERKKQKKLAKKKAKRNNKLKHLQATSGKACGESGYIRMGLKNPISRCLMDYPDYENGMATVTVIKKINSETILMGAFVVDAYCLGVKDCFISPKVLGAEKDLIHKGYVDVEPAYAKKLILGAVEYASQFDFSPHKDFNSVMRIFDGIDEHDCTYKFEYGKDGKPLFFAGPYDSPEKCSRIISQLQAKTGTDGSHFVMPAGSEEFDLKEGEWEMNKELRENI